MVGRSAAVVTMKESFMVCGKVVLFNHVKVKPDIFVLLTVTLQCFLNNPPRLF